MYMRKLWAPCQYVAAKAKSSSLSEKSERDLPTSERENGWWVAYGSNWNSHIALPCWPIC